MSQRSIRNSVTLPGRGQESVHVPIFVVSSLYSKLPEFDIPPDGEWLAHDEFLPKPLDMARLLEKIRSRIEIAGETTAPRLANED